MPNANLSSQLKEVKKDSRLDPIKKDVRPLPPPPPPPIGPKREIQKKAGEKM